MLSSKAADRINKNIEVKPSRDMERRGSESTSSFSTHTRSRPIISRKSKIPTNVGHMMRPESLMKSQVEESPRILNDTSSGNANAAKASSIVSGGFPTSKSLTTASSPPVNTKTPKSTSNCMEIPTMLTRSLETQFATKKKRYAKLHKELSGIQKDAADLYAEMSRLREKMIKGGAKDPGKIDKVDFPPMLVQNLIRSTPLSECATREDTKHAFVPNISLTSELVSTTVSKIQALPRGCIDACNKMLHEYAKLLKLLSTFEGSQEQADIKSEIERQIHIFQNENACLERHREEAKNFDEMSMEITQKFATLCHEVELSRDKIRQLENVKENTVNEITNQLGAALKEKEAAKAECEQLRERELAVQTELQKLRTVVQEMETKISEDGIEIVKLQGCVQNLEMQVKSTNFSAETPSKTVEKNLKNNQTLLGKTERWQDSAQLRRDEVTKEKEVWRMGLDKQLTERDEKITELQRQKREIIEVVNPAFFNGRNDLESDDGEKIHDKIIEALAKTMHELQSNSKNALEENKKLQRQLAENKLRDSKQSKNDEKSVLKDRMNTLEKQANELRFSVKELTRRNEELEIALNQKQLEIEEQDRLIREHKSIMKAREEAMKTVTGNNTPADKIAKFGDSSILKKAHAQRDLKKVDQRMAERAENVEQLYSTLQAKETQIAQLEQLIEQMEVQQERAQEQRTRLEKKIAQLQVAMHCKKGHGYVSPENLELSTTKVSPYRESCRQNDCRPFSGPKKFLSSLQTSACANAPSSSGRAQSPLPVRQPSMRRSKTLNSFNLKTQFEPNKVYTSQIMEEVARALKRERDYDYEKRKLSIGGITECLKKDHNTTSGDYINIADDHMREAFYNWLIKPWMFSGKPPNVIISSSDLNENRWMTDRSPDRTVLVRVKSNDRLRGRERLTNNCSSKKRYDSTTRQRRSGPEQSCPATPAAAQTNYSTHLRKKRT